MAKRFLVTGATGQLGAYLVRELVGQGDEVVAWAHARPAMLFDVHARPVELTDREGLTVAFREATPDVVIHAAAMAAVGDCARDPDRATAVNVRGTESLAQLCLTARARLLFVSTDLVFDGEAAPYAEAAEPRSLSVYGQSKAAAEQSVRALGQVVVRVSLLFGPSLTGRPNFFDAQVAAIRGGQPMRLFHDEWRTPLDVPTAARALIDIARSDATGVFHVGGPDRMSRLAMGQRIAAHLNVDSDGLVAVSRTTVSGEPRPRDTSLDSTRWRGSFPDQPWPTFEQALGDMGIAAG